jgi:hypothetical protein
MSENEKPTLSSRREILASSVATAAAISFLRKERPAAAAEPPSTEFRLTAGSRTRAADRAQRRLAVEAVAANGARFRRHSGRAGSRRLGYGGSRNQTQNAATRTKHHMNKHHMNRWLVCCGRNLSPRM